MTHGVFVTRQKIFLDSVLGWLGGGGRWGGIGWRWVVGGWVGLLC